MSTGSVTSPPVSADGRTAPDAGAGRDRFGLLVHSEWTKLRTVRGWLVALIVAGLVIIGIGQLNHSSCGSVSPSGAAVGCSALIGPGGEAVTDSFYFAHQPMAGAGAITVRMSALTSQPGSQATLSPWAKAGIIIKASTRPGSAYAAMMVTGGHGVRMQYDYTGDIAGLPGPVSGASPRWLRLTRSGDTVAGYESVNGARWTRVGTVRLAGLPATVQAGLFAADPGTSQSTSSSVTGNSAAGGVAAATATFDEISVRSRQAGGSWSGDNVGGRPAPGAGFQQAGRSMTVTGSGDIAPGSADGGGTPVEQTLLGVFGGLIAVIVVAAMFMTAEYRRGLIRITFAASPSRGRVLAAKAVVLGSVTFVAGLAAAIIAVPLGVRLLRANGNYVLPVSTLTEARVIAGTAALLAVAAILALALGALLRSSAAAITIAITVLVLPYLLTISLPKFPAGAADWMLRVTPAAGFAIQQSIQPYPQVIASYTPGNGYYPLAPWAGFAVLCGYALLALGLAVVLIRRRDA
jgi:ABC-type transport system involved in multi-copper enzyme maturation permease subunit